MGNTITIPSVELFVAGRHAGDSYSTADLRRMCDAANEVGFTPPVKIGQVGDADRLLKAEGLPAFGWIRNLRMKGEKLLGDLTDVPRRVAELIRNGAYTRLSPEIYWNFSQNGKTWPRVLKAVSLLGAEIPPVTNLKDIEAMYGMAAYASNLPPGTVKSYMGEIAVMPVAAGSHPGGNGQDDFQKDKDTVNYRGSTDLSERCGTCKFFLGAAASGSIGSCGLVAGEIASDALCDLYEVRAAFDFPTRVTERPRAEGSKHMTTTRVTIRYLSDQDRATAGAKIDALTKQHVLLHPERTYADALTIVALENPELWNSYQSAEPPAFGAVMQAEAGEGIAAAARRLQKRHPELDIEEATLRAMSQNPELTAAYAGYEPGGGSIEWPQDDAGNRAGDVAGERIADADDPARLLAAARKRILDHAEVIKQGNDEMVARRAFGYVTMPLGRAVEIALADPDYSADTAIAGRALRAEFNIPLM